MADWCWLFVVLIGWFWAYLVGCLRLVTCFGFCVLLLCWCWLLYCLFCLCGSVVICFGFGCLVQRRFGFGVCDFVGCIVWLFGLCLVAAFVLRLVWWVV